MIKIRFLLKKPNKKEERLEYITITEPKVDKSQKFVWGYRYLCEVYLSDINYNYPAIYGTNPINTFQLALEIAKIHLQGFISSGYIIKEVETKKPWVLEKGKNLSERIDDIKNNKDISADDKKKILSIIKESFGKDPSPIKDQVNKLID